MTNDKQTDTHYIASVTDMTDDRQIPIRWPLQKVIYSVPLVFDVNCHKILCNIPKNLISYTRGCVCVLCQCVKEGNYLRKPNQVFLYCLLYLTVHTGQPAIGPHIHHWGPPFCSTWDLICVPNFTKIWVF